MQSALEKKFLKLATRYLGEGRARGLSILLLLVRRDLKLKYRSSYLGYAWSMMNPLLSMLIVTLVFSHVVKDIPQYPLHVLSGVLAWNMCTLAISGGAQSLVQGGGLLRKIKMQSWIFPFVPVGLGTVNLCLSAVPFLVIYFAYGNLPHWSWFGVPLILALLAVFLLGLSLLLSVVNVFFRDVGHMLEPILSLTFYATPIIFDRNLMPFPPWVKVLLSFNPFAHYIEVFRACLLGQTLKVEQIAICLVLALVSFFAGCVVYQKTRNAVVFEV